MTDLETSFTVEVLGFSEGADPETLAESVSSFFGISIEEGRRLVRKAPIRVKRGASPEVTQRLVRQLRKLGASVLVRNEQTNDERTYHSTGTARTKVDVPPEETLESDEGDAPSEEAPNVAVVAAPEPLAEGPLAGDEAPPDDAEAPADPEVPPISSQPSDRTSPSTSEEARGLRRDTPDPDRPSGPNSSRRSATPLSIPPPSSPSGSLAPPASPILGMPAPSAAKLDFCGSCKGPVDKGETCAKCGWNNAEKERHCRQCKRKLVVVSAVSRRSTGVVITALGAFAIAAALFIVLGPAGALAGVGIAIGIAMVVDAGTLRFACKECTIAVMSARLQKEEEARLRTARIRSFGGAGAAAAATIVLIAIAASTTRALSDSSWGIAWTLPVPRLNGQLGTDFASIKVPPGNRRIRVSYAERPYIGGPVYFLTHVQYTHPSAPVEPDKAGLEASMKQVVEVFYNGSMTGSLEADGEALQGSFTGNFQGRPIHGFLRGIQNDHDMVITGVTATSPGDAGDPGHRHVLLGIQTTRDPQ